MIFFLNIVSLKVLQIVIQKKSTKKYREISSYWCILFFLFCANKHHIKFTV